MGRDKKISLYGPQGFIDHVHHKLQGYRWNLVHRYPSELIFFVTEIGISLACRTARFRLKNAFTAELVGDGHLAGGVVYSEPSFKLSTAVLEHQTPCLGFAIQESAHVNVWKNRLAELALPVGPWLRDLKRSIIENKPDDYPIRTPDGRERSLESLRRVLTVTQGQKIAYVTDVADTAANRKAIIALVQNADILFIEAPFAKADAMLAAERAHLTTAAAGRIAREAAVRRVEPFHFSARYAGKEQHMLSEVLAAFTGHPP